MPRTDGPRRLKTLETTIQLVEVMTKRNGAGVTEMAEALDLSKGAVHNHVATLHDEEFVVKRDGEYKPSFRFLNFAARIRNQNRLYRAGKEPVDDLFQRTELYTQLMVEEFGKGVCIYTQANQGVATDYHHRKLESRSHLHVSSTGKAILAYLPDERVEEIVADHGLPRYTDNTVVTEDRLWDELETIRDQGYALCDEEKLRGTRAVGAPVLGRDKRVIGSVSVSGPVSEIPDERFYDELPELTLGTSNTIELALETG